MCVFIDLGWIKVSSKHHLRLIHILLPARASEQGNVIGSVRIHIYAKYSTLPSGISVYIVPKVGIFPEAGG